MKYWQFTNNKIKFVHQLESVDCGPACLAMVANYHKRKISLPYIKKACEITRMGVSVSDIIQGAINIGFEAKGIRLSLDQLINIQLPLILYWKQEHFVVLYRIKQKKNGNYEFYIADPAYGKVRIDQESFQSEWQGTNLKGVAIYIEDKKSSKKINFPKLVSAKSKEFNYSIKNFLLLNKGKYVLAAILLILGLLANWAMPFFFQKTIDKGILGKSVSLVWILLLAQFILFFSNFLGELFSDLILTKLNYNLSIQLKENFLYKLLKLPIQYFDTRLNSDTLIRINEHSKIQSFITWKGLGFLIDILNFIIFSVILFFINPLVFFLFLAFSFFSVLWISFFLNNRKILEYAMFLKQSEMNNFLYEFIMNMPEIKVFSAQNTKIKKITYIQEKLNHLNLKSLFLNMYQLIGANFFSKIKELLIIGLCAYLIIHNKMTVGSLLSITYILGQLNGPVMNFTNDVKEFQDTIIAKERIEEVYSESEEAYTGKETSPSAITSINLKNVSFKYPGSFNPFVLHNINLQIPSNKITAIVGNSGSGKTTLLKLLLGYYKPTNGNIFLNNLDLSELNGNEWRLRCGSVLQDGHIFAGTIAQNIAIADENIDIEKMIEASHIACIYDFILSLPMKFDTKVGSVGMQLSGGQKQRLLIARAIYKNPEFIFFDEATSSLDANNEREIMDNLNKFFHGKTVVIIAHRLSTVKNADKIIVLNSGRIIEQGNHEKLVNNKSHYFQLIKNQLELGN